MTSRHVPLVHHHHQREAHPPLSLQSSLQSPPQTQTLSSSVSSLFPTRQPHRRWILLVVLTGVGALLLSLSSSYTTSSSHDTTIHSSSSSSSSRTPVGVGPRQEQQDDKDYNNNTTTTLSLFVWWNRISSSLSSSSSVSSTWQKNASKVTPAEHEADFFLRNATSSKTSSSARDGDDGARKHVSGDEDGDTGSPLEQQQPMTTSSSSSSRMDNQQPNYYKPDVVWLLSFPNSGTSYTISNTERVTNYSTASNYAGDWNNYVPPSAATRTGLHQQQQQYVVAHLGYNGPFVHKQHAYGGLPPTSLLTKTHCGGYCDDCRPSNYVLESARAFQDACGRGERMSLPNEHGNKKNRTRTSYSASVVQKVVHLIRNPFDNIVARLHLAVKRRKKMGWNEASLEQIFSTSTSISSSTSSPRATSYRAWCHYVDTRHAKALEETHLIPSHLKAPMMNTTTELPCHADWFRYVQWHNRAIEMTTEQQIPVHYLFYEDYSTKYNETLHDLLDFLNLVPTANVEPLPFQAGKTYLDLYSPEEIQAATRFVRTMATPACWNLLKRYF